MARQLPTVTEYLRACETGEYLYVYVDPSSVPQFHRTAAQNALQAASDDLGIPAPGLRWFRPARPGEPPDALMHIPARGRYNPVTNEAFVSTVVTMSELVETVRHEVAHAAGMNEAGAREYA